MIFWEEFRISEIPAEAVHPPVITLGSTAEICIREILEFLCTSKHIVHICRTEIFVYSNLNTILYVAQTELRLPRLTPLGGAYV